MCDLRPNLIGSLILCFDMIDHDRARVGLQMGKLFFVAIKPSFTIGPEGGGGESGVLGPGCDMEKSLSSLHYNIERVGDFVSTLLHLSCICHKL